MSQTVEGGRFQVLLPDETVAPDLTGIWQPIPAGLSFGAEAPPEVITWRVDLPTDHGQAARMLAEQAHRLHAAQDALPEATRRIEAMVREIQLTGAGGPSSFGPDEAMPAPERDLAVLVQATRGPESFYPGEEWIEGWRETARQAQAFIEQTRRALSPFAWIETAREGAPLGRSRAGWLGDVATVWGAGGGLAGARLHGEALALALETRAFWVRTAAQVARNAVLLAGVLSGPGGAILAIPATWRFIRQVLAGFQPE